MDNGEFLRLGVMGMSVDLIGFSVSSPSCMGNADITRCILVGNCLFKVGHLTFGLVNIELAMVIDKRNAGAVITAIFQTVQAFNQNRIGFAFTDISYYSTHIV